MTWTRQEKLMEEQKERDNKLKEYKSRVFKAVVKYADAGRYDRAEEIIKFAELKILEFGAVV